LSTSRFYAAFRVLLTTKTQKFFLVSIARWNHAEPIPNSEVKRCCGDDSLGVALRKNSSMPGFLFQQQNASLYLRVAFVIIGMISILKKRSPALIFASF
jgi:hypothetical protein